MSTPENDDLELEFREVAALLREGLPEPPSERPDDAVWSAIAAELGHAPRIPDIRHEVADHVGDGEASVHQLGSARSVRARSWSRPLIGLTAAAAVLLVVIPVALAVALLDSGSTRQAELAALGGWDGDGRAELSGQDLSISLDGSEAPEGSFYELWLLDVGDDDQVADLRSLGRVDVAADGTFVVPSDVDIERFDVVDVSIEPDDGNPDHSGASILRGKLTDA